MVMNKTTHLLMHLPITRFTYNSIKSNKKIYYKVNINLPKSTVVVPKSDIDLLKYLRKTYNQK